MKRFLTALGFAIEGILFGIRTQRHLRFHLIAAFSAVAFGAWRGLSPVNWMLLLLLIAAVISAEMMNTAIEAVVDLVSPEHHPLAKAAKDCAAGAVLVLSIASVAIAVIFLISGD
jgi:undecaprenol kinase/diacylglycerol kinase (ATP)